MTRDDIIRMARFKAIPNSPAKTQVWSEHQSSLKAAAIATTKEPA